MDKKQKKEAKDTARLLIYLAIAIFIIGIFAILPKIFSAQDMLFQTIAVVLSVVFTAVVTNQLLMVSQIMRNHVRGTSRCMRTRFQYMQSSFQECGQL